MITAVIPSRNKEVVEFCVNSLRKNSSFLNDIIVLWNGRPDVKLFEKQSSSFTTDFVEVKVLQTQKMDVYAMFNLGANLAQGQLVLFANDDMYFPKGWDDDVVNHFATTDFPDATPLTFTCVEPGVVDVSEKNICKDFGRTIETFDKKGFEDFAEGVSTIQPGLGWYMPIIFHKTTFSKYGYYDTTNPFPYPNDIYYFELLRLAHVHFYKSSQKVYHFQRLSQRLASVEQKKLNLCCGPERFPGFLNSDITGSEYDIDLSSGIIPFKENSFDEIVIKHGLEHFRYNVATDILRECYRILENGGKLHILVPDLQLACEDYILGFNRYENCAPAILRIYGQNNTEELVHRWGYTKDSLMSDLMDAGFKTVDVNEQTKHADEIHLIGVKNVQ